MRVLFASAVLAVAAKHVPVVVGSAPVDFRDQSQRGIGQNALVVYHWDNAAGAFAVVSRAAGSLSEKHRP